VGLAVGEQHLKHGALDGLGSRLTLMPKPLAHAPSPRRLSPTLTELGAMIADAKEDRDFYRGFLERAEAAGLSLSRGQRLLQKAETRIAQLQRKCEVMLGRESRSQPRQ
jgi:hypothetical protein